MNVRSITTRVLTVFVLAFICLNGFGALCVAYCQTVEASYEKADHCPIGNGLSTKAMLAAVPDVPAVTDIGADDDCCPLTVTFVAAPIESKQQTPAPSVMMAELSYIDHVLLKVERPFSNSIPPYRGPPIDRRLDRVMHCVLLI